MTVVAELQSWGQCSECGVSLWVEPSENEQRCACLCGAVSLHDAVKEGVSWAVISEADFQVIIDAEGEG